MFNNDLFMFTGIRGEYRGEDQGAAGNVNKFPEHSASSQNPTYELTENDKELKSSL